MLLFRCKYHLWSLQEFIVYMELKFPYEGDSFDKEMPLQGLLLCLSVFMYLASLHEHLPSQFSETTSQKSKCYINLYLIVHQKLAKTMTLSSKLFSEWKWNIIFPATKTQQRKVCKLNRNLALSLAAPWALSTKVRPKVKGTNSVCTRWYDLRCQQSC